MKFHEAKALRAQRAAGEHKMQPGIREDQSGSPVSPKENAPEPVDIAPDVAPEVRLLANKLGIDLNKIGGTGKRGRITLTDVRHAHAAMIDEKSGADLDQPVGEASDEIARDKE